VNNILSYNLKHTHSSIPPWRVEFTIFCHWFRKTYLHASATIQYLYVSQNRSVLCICAAENSSPVYKPFLWLSLPSHLTIKILPKYAIYILYGSIRTPPIPSLSEFYSRPPHFMVRLFTRWNTANATFVISPRAILPNRYHQQSRQFLIIENT